MTTDRILPEVAVRPRTGSSEEQDLPHAGPRPPVWPAGGRTAAPVMARRATAGAGGGPVTLRARAARFAKPRGEALLSTTARAGMLIGVSAAVYAVSLATVSGLESQAQADVASQNRPAIDALNQAKAANDALAASIQDADAKIRALAAQYNSVSGDMSAYQAQFNTLSALVAKIQGSAAALNATISLPSVSIHGAIASGGTTVITTTSASGKP